MKTSSTLLATIAVISLASCAKTPTFGDKLNANASASKALAAKWKKGSQLEKEGQSQQSKGEKMQKEGEKLVKKGRKNEEKGRILRLEAESEAKAAEAVQPAVAATNAS